MEFDEVEDIFDIPKPVDKQKPSYNLINKNSNINNMKEGNSKTNKNSHKDKSFALDPVMEN